MNCCGSKEEFVTLAKQCESNQLGPKIEYSNKTNAQIIELPRGGWIVETKLGGVQYGMVPDTIKDCLSNKVNIPSYYIVPKNRFDKFFCVSVCEFEFPAYFNFFAKKRRINLVCNKKEEDAVRIVFQETLLGPKSFDKFHEDFSKSIDKNLIPNIKSELDVFNSNPFNPKQQLSVDLLINFIIFDEQTNTATIIEKENTLKIIRSQDKIIIIENDVPLVEEEDKVQIKLVGDMKNDYEKFGMFINPQFVKDSEMKYKEQYLGEQFKPPTFGITVLGSSHGMDPQGNTSGYILWVNNRGIMIDPPAFLTLQLKKKGIPIYMINWVIITHCHADHDSGVFQKIFESNKVEFITTKTIMNSFLVKYSAMTDIPQETLSKFFTFHPVVIGSPLKINGAEFHFFYSVHSIPAIGFICKYGDKSMFFSSDMYYDPEKIQEKFVKPGFMTQQRYEQLTNLDFRFNHDLVLHEAGVPPIHTPMKVLAELPEKYKENMYLVHVSAKDVPKDQNLKVAKTGIDNTIVFMGEYYYNLHADLQLLVQIDLIARIPLFQQTPFNCIRNLLNGFNLCKFKAGEVIVKEGEQGEELFIIVSGVVQIYSQTKGKEFQIYYCQGDFFGETFMFDGYVRQANVVAVTDAQLLQMKRNDFEFYFSGDDNIKYKLNQLFLSRQNKSLAILSKNKILSQLNSAQMIQFEIILQYQKFQKNEMLWKFGDQSKFGLLLASGQVSYEIQNKEEKQELHNLQPGTLICDMNSVLNNSVLQSQCSTLTEVEGFVINKDQLIQFLQNNPGIYLISSHLYFIN